MKSAGFVFVIFSGYIAMSFGVLKIFWRQFGVHFYAPTVAHPPHHDPVFDYALILIFLISGMSLVAFRAVVPALLSIIAAFFVEYFYLHHDPHTLLQTAFAVGTIVGQMITLLVYLIGFTAFGKGHARREPAGPSRGRPL